MKTSIYAMAVETYVPMLRSLSHVLDQGAKKAGSGDLVNARLAPDMYPLAQQVRMACDQANDSTARLSGQQPPQFEDNEKSLDELKARIARTLEYVESARASAFEGAEDRYDSDPRKQHRFRNERPAVLKGLGAAALLLPRRHCLRHPAPQRRRHRQARLHEPGCQIHPPPQSGVSAGSSEVAGEITTPTCNSRVI
jgi:hypothetical protein